MRCLSKKIYFNKKIKKKLTNIGIKVPDVEWETTGQNARPLALKRKPWSCENKELMSRNNLIYIL